MHHKYHTEAIVLGTRNIGESDRLIIFFTREMGVIFAKAQGIRKLQSKLRFAIQAGSCVRVDLVKGRDIWRVTSATHVPLADGIFKDSNNAKLYIKILSLIYRLYRSENAEPELFDDVIKTAQILSTNIYSGTDRDFFEISSVMMVLTHLGYWEQEEISLSKPYEMSLTDEILQNRTNFIVRINKALKDTQL